MNIYKLKFRDIMSSEILYYDDNMETKCLEICRKWNITYLPDINRQAYHIRKGDKFILIGNIPEKRRFKVDDNILDPKVMNVFRYDEDELLLDNHKSQHDVAFVFDKDKLAGIVHICDYNKTAVMVELFKDVSSFEENLRTLLFERVGRDMDKVIGEIKAFNLHTAPKIKARYPENEQILRKLAPFQGVFLKSLMKDYALKKSLGIFEEKDIDPICSLRNQVMHSSDRVSGIRNEEIRSYDLESLEVFLTRIKTFERAYLKLQNRLRLGNWT